MMDNETGVSNSTDAIIRNIFRHCGDQHTLLALIGRDVHVAEPSSFLHI